MLFLGSGALRAAQSPVPESLRDLVRLQQNSNPERLETLKRQLRERGIPFEVQTFSSPPSPHGRTRGTNLIATVGAGPREITVGAHYDAVESPEGGLIGGVVDNGAAAIILVRMAEALTKHTLRHRVRIVFYDMEEMGAPGSQAYIAAHKDAIAAALNLDISGMGSTVAYAPGKAEGTDRIQRAVRAACSDLHADCLEFANFPPSDDRSFHASNLPVVAVAFIPPLQSPRIQTVMKMLHSRDDSIDKVDPASLDAAVQFMLQVVLKLDAALSPASL